MERFMGVDEIDKALAAVGLKMKPYGITVLVFEHSEGAVDQFVAVSYTHLRAHETEL
jgi:hypothetical protein